MPSRRVSEELLWGKGTGGCGSAGSQLAEQSRGWSAREGDARVARHARLLDEEKKT